MNAAADPAPAPDGASDPAGLSVHILPLRVLAGVWIALLALTWITVAVTRFDLGAGNLWAALGIATIKATLVALYFMHLRYDNPFNAILLVATLCFIVLFIGLVLVDTAAYGHELQQGPAPGIPR